MNLINRPSHSVLFALFMGLFLICNGTTFSLAVNGNRTEKEIKKMEKSDQRPSKNLSEQEILAIAHREIESMGYRIADLQFKIGKQDRVWEVQYWPGQKKEGYIVMGGGFTVYLNEDGTVREMLRDQ